MAYVASRIYMEERLQQYPSLQFFFDIHRDGIPPEVGRAEINGDSYARILFVVGRENPEGFAENYAIATRLTEMLEEKRPGITRAVRLSGGPGFNGVYNQDIAPTVQLIEVGNPDTTIDEAIRSLEVLGEVLAEFILEQIQ